ncbi:arsenate reductase ArsC [Oscillatoria laete-virens NRMC-F 0139]|nr:arsenate reductase ArsC [Oscillatoria laete-virens]MDL5054017.1 arsenate reductase ArsC [Oscillatoria laete-virens NRMC-F 0139]
MSTHTDTPSKILFLCTGNSARSIMAEYLMKRLGKGKFEAYSAGSHPTGKVNPFAIRTLKEIYKIEPDDARSKSMDEFKDTHLDFVITVCDNARESCPVWPGQPIVAHWGSEDPAAVEGDDEKKFRAFQRTAQEIYRRLDIFTNLPFHSLDKIKLAELTKNIGQEKA